MLIRLLLVLLLAISAGVTMQMDAAHAGGAEMAMEMGDDLPPCCSEAVEQSVSCAGGIGLVPESAGPDVEARLLQTGRAVPFSLSAGREPAGLLDPPRV